MRVNLRSTRVEWATDTCHVGRPIEMDAIITTAHTRAAEVVRVRVRVGARVRVRASVNPNG